ncbi:MAG TPA: hypothetical protein VEH04_09610 [Verrucomicrobiae bacterium]|nr:hypothetical protein [Verrucomicrobiae bacterium]
MSADGRLIAFDSESSAIVPGVLGTHRNIYLRDRTLGETTLISRRFDGPGGGSGDSFRPLISPGGWHVIFHSQATNLVAANDPNGTGTDVYARDLSAGTMTRISGAGGGSFENAQFSLNGRYVVFETTDDAFVAGDTNGTWDVFVRDLFTGQTTLVSRRLAGSGSGNGFSRSPVITPNGRFVAFQSTAGDLVSGDTNALTDVFVRDMITGVTRLVSVNCHGSAAANGASEVPDISADGRYITFHSVATDLAPGDFSMGPAGVENVFMRDLIENRTRLISVRMDAQGGGNMGRGATRGSSDALISANGNTVAFISSADNLVMNDRNLNQDLFFVRPNVSAAAADLIVTMQANPASPAVNDNITLTVIVMNTGPSPAANVVVSDLLPVGLAFISAFPSQGTLLVTNHAIVASLGTIASGANASVTLQAKALVPGSYLNAANAFSDVADVNTVNNYASVVISVDDTGGNEGPALSASRAGNVISIRWPSSAAGYALQTKTNLSAAVPWQTLTSGILDNGMFRTYSMTNSPDPARFFRLRVP